MRPISTYRIQLNFTFTFTHLKGIIDYLHKLGISTIYASPFFESRKGSVHGYDVVNPQLINPEIGTLAEFVETIKMLRERNMKWIQDIVPNHMAFDSGNPWLMDIFEKGHHSDYYSFFDIDWNHPDPELNGKVLAPFLGAQLDEVIDKGEIKLEYNQRGFFVTYYSLQYPLSWASYADVLSLAKDRFESVSDNTQEFRHIAENFKSIKNNFKDSFEAENTTYYKEQLFQYYSSNKDVKESLDSCLLNINKKPADLLELLNQQFYKLCYWRTTENKINYRRFFTVNDLICLNIHKEKVFSQYHQFIKTLLDEKLIDGLRIDHIDGLYNPTQYVKNLRELVGKDVYIIVEKILESEEALQNHWPIQGTSGYEFLSCVNHLLTNKKNKDQFEEIYKGFINDTFNYDELVFKKKLFILEKNMGGELDNLMSLIEGILDNGVYKTVNTSKVKEALATFLASFQIYRIYSSQKPLNEADLNVLKFVFGQAKLRRPDLLNELSILKDIVIGSEKDSDHANDLKLKFVMRSQQFTGPLAAKGVEDTVFYIYNRLISHNEVGDSPYLFGMDVTTFHQRMEQRNEKTPLSLNATSTHDTKRGEDARMRINVLSELPEEWTSAVFNWKEINQKHKKTSAQAQLPDDNTEYFIYQTLIGGFPMEGMVDESFKQRVKDYLIKAVREAKVNSDWSSPDLNFEGATTDFIDSILEDEDFLRSFNLLFDKAKHFGMIYSLAQTVLKITAPGIPDIYQGSELWDLSFVDPDNRRAVDFELRQKYLNQIIPQEGQNQTAVLEDLVKSREDGRIKLFTIFETLNLRNNNSELFLKGEYIPLTFSGPGSEHAVAFARRWEDKWAVVIIPKNIAEISAEEKFGVGEKVWENTSVVIPGNAPEIWQNVFSREQHKCIQVERPVPIHQYVSNEINLTQFSEMPVIIENVLQLSEIFAHFPVAVLVNE